MEVDTKPKEKNGSFAGETFIFFLMVFSLPVLFSLGSGFHFFLFVTVTKNFPTQMGKKMESKLAFCFPL